MLSFFYIKRYNISIGVNMKVVFVVDCISNINNKINLIKSHFGNDIYFIVKSHFATLFKSFGYEINATYSHNLAKTIHTLLLKTNVDDILVYYSSANIDEKLLQKFISAISNGEKIVNVMPNYNSFERMNNGAYNIYVRSIFKAKDSMASPKLQFLPALFVNELMATHFANKLFEIDPKHVKNIYVEDKEVSNSLKVKTKFNKFQLIPIIVALVITMGLLLTIAFTRINYIMILLYVVMYVLDIMMSLLYQCKLHFDDRFLK